MESGKRLDKGWLLVRNKLKLRVAFPHPRIYWYLVNLPSWSRHKQGGDELNIAAPASRGFLRQEPSIRYRDLQSWQRLPSGPPNKSRWRNEQKFINAHPRWGDFGQSKLESLMKYRP